MNEQQNHLTQLIEQRNNLSTSIWKIFKINQQELEKFFLKHMGAIEYLEAVGVTLPEPEVTEEAEAPEPKKHQQKKVDAQTKRVYNKLS